MILISERVLDLYTSQCDQVVFRKVSKRSYKALRSQMVLRLLEKPKDKNRIKGHLKFYMQARSRATPKSTPC